MNTGYGLLINEKDIKLQRSYFVEMCKLIGVKVIHRAPRANKHYTTYGEIDANFYAPELTACIFDEYPDQRTMKRLGWNAELQENASVLSVIYDLKGLQVGSLFVIPSAFDPKTGRLFRVVEISGIMIYPCSLTCKLVPEFDNTFSNSSFNHERHSFTLLNREEDD